MNIVRGFVIYALCLSFFFSLGAAPAFAAYSKAKPELVVSQVSEHQALLDATVNLYCRVKSGNKTVSTTGTGVFIDSRGIILTNAHVAQYFLLSEGTSRLKSDCTVRVGSPAKDAYTADLLYLSPVWISKNAAELATKKPKGLGENDFALLYVTGAKKGGVLPTSFPTVPLKVATSFAERDRVVVAGYPAGALNYADIKNKLMVVATSSTIASLRTFEVGKVDIVALSPSKAASSGVSGGPIVRDGQLIAIVTTMSTTKKKGEGSLRGITIPYIDRAIREQTGLPLQTIYAGDLALRASTTRKLASAGLFKIIEKGLRLIR